MFKCREKGGEMGGENRVRFVFKMGLEGQWGDNWGDIAACITTPIKLKNWQKTGFLNR